MPAAARRGARGGGVGGCGAAGVSELRHGGKRKEIKGAGARYFSLFHGLRMSSTAAGGGPDHFGIPSSARRVHDRACRGADVRRS